MPQTTAPDPNLRTLDPQSPVSANGTGCDLRGIGRDAHTYIHTYLCTYLLTYLCTYLLTYLLTYLCTYLLTYVLTYLLTYVLTYLLTYVLTYLCTYLLTYLLTYVTYIIYTHPKPFSRYHGPYITSHEPLGTQSLCPSTPPVSDRIGARP